MLATISKDILYNIRCVIFFYKHAFYVYVNRRTFEEQGGFKYY